MPLPAVFVDTSAWFAHFEPADRHHETATAAMGKLLGEARVLTSDYVLCELLNLSLARKGFQAARRAGEALRKEARVTVLEVFPEVREEAWRLFLRYHDQTLSFTDCTSFALIEEQRIPRVFTYDQDFRLTGREIVG
jgi:predicted nucleic acid-binding protein